MTIAEICKDLISRSPRQQQEVAVSMGMTPQGLSNKLRRNSLSAQQMMNLLDILGYEIKIVEKSGDDEVLPRTRGVGERIRMMVNGQRFDTYRADALGHTTEAPDGMMFDELYRTDDGQYFVAHYCRWPGGSNAISPIEKSDAIALVRSWSR